MDPLDWLEDEQLLRFFHRHKTEMSCMEKPHIFLSQLRDHDLVPEDQYKMVTRMRSKDNIKRGLYTVLDLLEKQQSKRIKEFWSCIFKETILNEYPTLRLLRNSLMDGSFQFDKQPESEETDDSDKGKRKEDSEDQEGKENSVKKKRKLRNRRVCNDDDDEEEEQAGPSTLLTPRKKPKKLCFSSPLKKGEKTNIWTWPIYKLQLPVTCGDKEGTLNRQRLAEGEKCIVVGKHWFTPQQFEKFAGKQSYKNWKLSIQCNGTRLGEIIKDGHLKAGKFYIRGKRAKKSQIPSGNVNTESDGEEDEDEDEDCDPDEEDQVSSSSKDSSTAVTDEGGEDQVEQLSEASHDSDRKVFNVTCRGLSATLHKKRFASGTCGKSIRTETSWMTPVEFMKEASCPPDASWRKDIEYQGEPLNVLVEAKILTIHSLLCSCKMCKPDSNDVEHQKNDDECGICKSDKGEALVVCDHCPRSFHQKCHLPHVDDAILRDDSPWMCTFCVFRTTREWLYWDEMEKEAVMSRQISQRMLQCQYLLLYLCSADDEQTFTTDPRSLQGYSTVIKTPMWLGKIADKLQNQLYQTVREFESDVQLVFTNCATYNRDNAEFLTTGNRLKELFDREFKTVFNISEETVD